MGINEYYTKQHYINKQKGDNGTDMHFYLTPVDM